jgi:hypothetical protein
LYAPGSDSKIFLHATVDSEKEHKQQGEYVKGQKTGAICGGHTVEVVLDGTVQGNPQQSGSEASDETGRRLLRW